MDPRRPSTARLRRCARGERGRLALLGVVLTLGLGALAAAWLVPLPARLLVPDSTVVEYRDGQPAHVFVAPDGRWRIGVAPGEVDPAYLRALLALEDRRFHWHPGVDPLALVRAAATNVARGRRVSGASTLTLQLVRMLEPRPRTLSSKLLEALRAFQLELRLGKEDILAAYLRFAPYGRNVEGVEAAALAYFGHRATHLSAAEVATLLAVPQSPARRFPVPGNQERLRAGRDEVARRLARAGALPLGPPGASVTPAAVLAAVRDSPLPERLAPFPREAPHAAAWLRAQHPGVRRLRTTLEAGAQRLAERRMRQAGAEMAPRGVHNGAAVVVDRARAEVVALVGSFDFFDEAHGGQLPGFAVARSPGSALKPLLYALALDEGLAGPEQLVADVPAVYGTYAPRNFDGRFQGLVRLEDALSQSLNLPFVRLLQQVGVERFLGVLRRAGVASLRAEPGYYGLSAAVGGLELTPLELAGVYLALAEGGQARPLRVLAEPGRAGPALALFSPGAAWLTRRALSLKDRPDFPLRRVLSGAPARVHWKTGTSFGQRDAWAAGSGPAHTAVVWLGNFDNSASVHLVGAEAAGPVLFDLLEALGPRGRATGEEEPPPPDLVPVEVCAHSGHLPGAACPRRRATYARRTHVPTTRCPYHVQVEVEVASGLAVAPHCHRGEATERRTYLRWPASVRRWLSEQQRRLPEPPAWAPGCTPAAGPEAPEILSPPEGQVALLLPGVAAAQQELPLEAEGEGELAWFIDGAFVGAAHADERLWWRPSPGTHEVLVTDAAGRSARRTLRVRERR